MPTIAQLPAAATLTGSELVPIVQNGITVRTTMSAIGLGAGGPGTTYSADNSTLSLTGTTFSIASVPLNKIGQGGAANGQALTWNGAQWTPTTLAAGTTYTGVGAIHINGAGAVSVDTFGSAAPGVVPASGGGTANFLRADGNWSAPTVAPGGITQGGATNGQALAWNGTAWVPTTINATLGSIANNTVLANTSGGNAAPVATPLSTLLDSVFGSVQGSIFYRGASAWAELVPSTSGYLLQTNGSGSNPSWVAAPSGGGGTGLDAYGAATTVSTSSTVTLGNPRTYILVSGASAAITVTVPNGTVDGQKLLIEVPPNAYQHTIALTAFGSSETFSASSPNNGFSFHAVWNASQTTWIPFNYDGGYKLSDLTAASVVAAGDKIGILATADGKDYGATVTLLAAAIFALGGTLGKALTITPVPLTDGSTINTDASAGNDFTCALSASGHVVANPSNLPAGKVQYLVWAFTGAYTIGSWGGYFDWGTTGAPTFTGTLNMVYGRWDGTRIEAIYKGGF